MKALVVVVGIALLAAGCGSAHGVRLSPPATMQSPTNPLSARATTRALRIAERDRVVGPLLRSGGVAAASASIWFRGIDLRVRLRRPVDVRGAILPYAVVPPDAPSTGVCRHPYALGWLRVDARSVTILMLLVDIHTPRVAEVDVNGSGRKASAAPGLPHPDCEEIPTG